MRIWFARSAVKPSRMFREDKRPSHNDLASTSLRERCPNVQVFLKRLPGALLLIFLQTLSMRGQIRY